MLLTLAEIGIEAVMILAVIAAAASLVYLIVLTILERRELARTAPSRRLLAVVRRDPRSLRSLSTGGHSIDSHV